MTDHPNEGNFQWLDGSTWNGWTQWGTGEPDNKQGAQNNAHCVALKGGQNTWWDMKCNPERKFICQTPGPAACVSATTAAPTCNNGFYGNGITCTPCPANTHSSAWDSTIDVVTDCINCGTGSHTNSQTGQTSCTHCHNGYYGNGVTCTACPANKYSAAWSGSIATASDCTPCNANSHTNGATGQTACTHCDNGYYGNGVTCTACPVNTFSSSWDSSVDVVGDCTACSANSHTNGQIGQTACTHCNNGFYGNGVTCTACPANKYSASWSGSIALAVDCTPCNANSHTNGQTGKTACTHCDNGYYGNGVTCTACGINKYSTSWSGSIATASDCTPCNANSHTNSQTGKTACTHCDNGYYGNGVTCTACPVNKYSASWSGSIAAASDCTPCNANSHTNGQTGKTACTHCDNGYYGNGVICTACPEDTYSTTWSGSITSASQCTDCPVGHSTNGPTGQTSSSSCIGKNCKRLMALQLDQNNFYCILTNSAVVQLL